MVADCNPFGKRWRRLWRKLAQRAGLPAAKQHPHAAKFTARSLLAERGSSIAAIRQHLGHKSIASSAVYAEMSPAQAAAVAADTCRLRRLRALRRAPLWP